MKEELWHSLLRAGNSRSHDACIFIQEMILFEPRTMKQEFPAPFAAAAGLFCINGGIHDWIYLCLSLASWVRFAMMRFLIFVQHVKISGWILLLDYVSALVWDGKCALQKKNLLQKTILPTRPLGNLLPKRCRPIFSFDTSVRYSLLFFLVSTLFLCTARQPSCFTADGAIFCSDQYNMHIF